MLILCAHEWERLPFDSISAAATIPPTLVHPSEYKCRKCGEKGREITLVVAESDLIR